MSGSVGTASPVDSAWMSSLISDAATVRQKLDTLTNQASNGLVATTYGGLGSGASISLDLNPQISSLQTWQNNIDAATGPAQVTQATMTQLQSIAQNLYGQLNNLNGMSTSDVDSIAADAQTALSQVTNLLDATDGSQYVFGGADTANPPVPDPNDIMTSGFYTQIATAVAGLGINGAAATAAATMAVATSNTTGTSPFSAYMSQSATTLQADIPVVQVGQQQTVEIGLLASANASITSTGTVGTTTTGSYMRDLLLSLATIASLSSSQVNDAGFMDFVQATRTTLGGAVTAMAQDAGVLGDTQTSLTKTQTQLADTQTALTLQVGATQNVDMASTLSNLSLVQTQMQASYQVIAGMSNLSLVKFLPVG
jgi:flagellar hook-associated protein 3 FlgL